KKQFMNKNANNPRFRSFAHAWNGIRIMIKEESNVRIHLLLGMVATALGFLLNIEPYELLSLLLTIGLVLVTEAVNTALERLSDHVTPEAHIINKTVKELAYGAVLIGAIIAVCVGLIRFVENIVDLLFTHNS